MSCLNYVIRSYSSFISFYDDRIPTFDPQCPRFLKNIAAVTFYLPGNGTQVFPGMELCLVVKADRTKCFKRKRRVALKRSRKSEAPGCPDLVKYALCRIFRSRIDICWLVGKVAGYDP